MRFTLRKKLLFLSVLLAIIPLAIAGWTMIRITQDELKSAANDELSITADQLAKEIDDLYQDIWRAPLMLIRNGIDDSKLGTEAKVALLTKGINDIADIVSLQLILRGTPQTAFLVQDNFKAKLTEAGLVPTNILKLDEDKINNLAPKGEEFIGDLMQVKEIDTWLVTMLIPLKEKLMGMEAVIAARINLDRLKERFETHPFTKTGIITLVDKEGKKIFDPERKDLKEFQIVTSATELLHANTRVISVAPYTRPGGEHMLGAYSFPRNFDWAVISERSEADAYIAVTKMIESLLYWVFIGLAVAVIGAVLFSGTISRPILEVGKVAQAVGTGNFGVRVSMLKSNDEISDLGKRINEMIEGLRERFELQKFVSGQTIDAIKKSDADGIKRGGERKTATVFFSDIRGFTSFSEKVEPEVVIEMLNTYLSRQAEIVKKYNGDVDKFVGDELVAVFRGSGMEEAALECAIEIHEEIRQLNESYKEYDNICVGIGINSGSMVMGAMGSEERMDYTIIGDNVNLGARLCSAAKPNQTIISENVYKNLKNLDNFNISKLPPIMVKGKAKPIEIFEIVSKNGAIQEETIEAIDNQTQLPTGAHLLSELNTKRQHNELSHPVSIAICSVENLDFVYKKFPNAVADKVMPEIAAVITKVLRKMDMPGRWDKNKFVIILPDTEVADAKPAMSKIRQYMSSNKVVIEGQEIMLVIKFGVCLFSEIAGVDGCISTLIEGISALPEDRDIFIPEA